MQAAIVLLGRPASAEEPEPIRIDVRAPAGCPDAEAFAAEVVARTSKARVAVAGEAARTFRIILATSGKAGQKARGSLTLLESTGPGDTREVRGKSCAEVSSALALIAALAIDPKASTAPQPPPPRRSPPTVPLVSLPSPERVRRSFAPIPWWGPVGVPLPAAVDTRRGSLRVAAVFQVGGASGLAPPLIPMVSGAIEVAFLGPALVAPAFRLSLWKADSGRVAAGLGAVQTRFHVTAARLAGCPLHLKGLGPLIARPCVFVDAGRLEAEGYAPVQPVSVARPWAALGLLGRVQLALLDGLLLEAEGGTTVPLVRDTFLFTPSVTAHAVPAAGAFFSGGVGMHFR